MSNSWVKYSCSRIEPRKPRNFCPPKITRYTVFRGVATETMVSRLPGTPQNLAEKNGQGSLIVALPIFLQTSTSRPHGCNKAIRGYVVQLASYDSEALSTFGFVPVHAVSSDSPQPKKTKSSGNQSCPAFRS